MEDCNSLVLCALENSGKVFDVLFAVVTAASAIAALTPTPADDHFFAKIYRVIDMLAFNFGHAKEQPGRGQGGRFVPK